MFQVVLKTTLQRSYLYLVKQTETEKLTTLPKVTQPLGVRNTHTHTHTHTVLSAVSSTK